MADGINQKVFTWARSMLRRRVGHGECWDLADRALRHAGAQSSTTSGSTDDYVWGTEIPITAVIGGDILQFRDHVVRTVTTTTTAFTNGSRSTDTEEKLEKRPHHTAKPRLYSLHSRGAECSRGGRGSSEGGIRGDKARADRSGS